MFELVRECSPDHIFFKLLIVLFWGRARRDNFFDLLFTYPFIYLSMYLLYFILFYFYCILLFCFHLILYCLVLSYLILSYIIFILFVIQTSYCTFFSRAARKFVLILYPSIILIYLSIYRFYFILFYFIFHVVLFYFIFILILVIYLSYLSSSYLILPYFILFYCTLFLARAARRNFFILLYPFLLRKLFIVPLFSARSAKKLFYFIVRVFA